MELRSEDNFDYSLMSDILKNRVDFLLAHGRTADATKATEQYATDCDRFEHVHQWRALDCVADAYMRIHDRRAEEALRKRVATADAEAEGVSP